MGAEVRMFDRTARAATRNYRQPSAGLWPEKAGADLMPAGGSGHSRPNMGLRLDQNGEAYYTIARNGLLS